MTYLISLLLALVVLVAWLGKSRQGTPSEAILSLARSMDPSRFYRGIRPDPARSRKR